MIHWARKIEFVTRKRKSQRIFSLGLHTILAVIKWIPGCTIFHFTDSVGWTKLMNAEFSETRLNKICQTGTNDQFAFQMQHLNSYSFPVLIHHCSNDQELIIIIHSDLQKRIAWLELVLRPKSLGMGPRIYSMDFRGPFIKGNRPVK